MPANPLILAAGLYSPPAVGEQIGEQTRARKALERSPNGVSPGERSVDPTAHLEEGIRCCLSARRKLEVLLCPASAGPCGTSRLAPSLEGVQLTHYPALIQLGGLQDHVSKLLARRA